jgi:hypothetical protein
LSFKLATSSWTSLKYMDIDISPICKYEVITYIKGLLLYMYKYCAVLWYLLFNPLSGNAPDFVSLLCLTPDNFTRQVDSACRHSMG